MNLLNFALYASIISSLRALIDVEPEQKDSGMPVGALLPDGRFPGRFDSDDNSYRHHWDRRWETTVSATITVIDQALTSVTTMIPLVYTNLSILTTVATVSGCPKTTVLVVSGTTTTTTSSTTTSLYITTSTALSLSTTTTTVTSTSYTYTKPCHPTERPCGCNRPRCRQRREVSIVQPDVAPVYSDCDSDDRSDEWDF